MIVALAVFFLIRSPSPEGDDYSKEEALKLHLFETNKTYCERDSQCKVSEGCCSPQATKKYYKFNESTCKTGEGTGCSSGFPSYDEVRCLNNTCRFFYEGQPN